MLIRESKTTVFEIMHDDLGMEKTSALLIIKLLTLKQKLVRKEISQGHLATLDKDVISRNLN